MSVEQVGTGKDIRPAHRAFIGYWMLMLVFAPLVVAPEAFALWVMNEANMQPPSAEGIAGMSGLVRGVALIAIAAIYVMKILIPQLSNRYQITEDRVIEIKGIIKRDQNTTELAHIRRVNARVGYVGRIMQLLGFKGYGDLICYTAGSGEEDITLFGLLDPVKVEGRIRELIAEHQQSRSEHTGGSSSEDAEARPHKDVSGESGELQKRVAMLEQRVAYLEHRVAKGAGVASQPVRASTEARGEPSKQEGGILAANVSGVSKGLDLTPPDGDVDRSGWDLSATLSEDDRAQADPQSPAPEEDYYTEPTPKMFGDGGELAGQPAKESEKGKKKGSGGESVGLLMDED